MSGQAATVAAYRACETITRSRAANFYYGIRLLRRDRRQAMCVVYAFARRVDDIGDGSLPDAEKLRRLDEQAQALSALSGVSAADDGGDQVIVALADATQRFGLAPDVLAELIAGVRMDVEGVRYERFEDLLLYCRRVAGAVGRSCLAIFGVPERSAPLRARAAELADDLGVALQLTNILRDLREDAEGGRVYLPAEDLRRFGIAEPNGAGSAGALLRSPGHLQELVRFEAARAQDWFERGMQLAPMLDRRSAACVLAMAGIYHRLLERIEAHPERALRERVSLPAAEKAWVAARSMLGGSP